METNSNPIFEASNHFKKRIKARFGVLDCNNEVQDEIIFRIEHHLYSHSVKGKTPNSRKYYLYTDGRLKSMCPNMPDDIKVVFNKIERRLITIMPND